MNWSAILQMQYCLQVYIRIIPLGLMLKQRSFFSYKVTKIDVISQSIYQTSWSEILSATNSSKVIKKSKKMFNDMQSCSTLWMVTIFGCEILASSCSSSYRIRKQVSYVFALINLNLGSVWCSKTSISVKCTSGFLQMKGYLKSSVYEIVTCLVQAYPILFQCNKIKMSKFIYSPARSRADRLHNQIQELHLGHKDQTTRVQEAEERVNLLEDGMKELKETLQLKVKSFQDQLVQVSNLVHEIKPPKEQTEDQFNQDLKHLEEETLRKLQEVIELRKQSEEAFSKKMQEDLAKLKEEVQSEQKERNDAVKEIQSVLENDLPELQEMLKSDVKERQEMDTHINTRLTEELHKLAQVIQTERQNRADSEAAMFDMLKDVVNRIKKELENERQAKEVTENEILGVLEETLNKIIAAQ